MAAQPARDYDDDSTAMVPYAGTQTSMDMVRPLVDPRAAQAAIAQYEALKAAIVRPGDVQKIQGRDFLKKAFWRRVATCFGLSLDLVSEQRGHDEAGHLFYSVLYRALAPNGRTMIADGYCSTAEAGRGGWPEHNVRATAHTRAKNRAISDLVGGGEVSAEEMQDEDERPTPRPQPATVRPAPKPVARTTVTQASDDPPPDPGNNLPWLTLRARMRHMGITSMAEADKLCKRACGQTWEGVHAQEDYDKIEAAIAKLEAGKAQAVAALDKARGRTIAPDNIADAPDFPDERDENGPDLASIATPHVRP
jgi:hypothetical protein